MWLINVETMMLEFVAEADPINKPYAILSHTWGDDEVVFAEMSRPYDYLTEVERDQRRQIREKRKGWDKVAHTCNLAKSEGLKYAWVDTCTIDKSSSAELSESINSMYRWYAAASVCYVILEDLPAVCDPASCLLDIHMKAFLPDCRWLTRGWTLQELIAPINVRFYDCEWNVRGTKDELRAELSDITGIDADVLKDPTKLYDIPVGKRMSWAANRKTTRIEDIAYSLLGIFDVNLPMIYGEGPKAFIRLQEAIARTSADLSLYAWSSTPNDPGYQLYRGLFATSPGEFASCRDIERDRDPIAVDIASAVATSRGMQFSSTMVGVFHGTRGHSCMLKLPFVLRKDGSAVKPGSVAIPLVRTLLGYVREATIQFTLPEEKPNVSRFGSQKSGFIHIPLTISPRDSSHIEQNLDRNHIFSFRHGNLMNKSMQLCIMPSADLRGFPFEPLCWDPIRIVFVTQGHDRFLGALSLGINMGQPTLDNSPEMRLLILCGLSVVQDKQGREDGAEVKLKPWVGLLAGPQANQLNTKFSVKPNAATQGLQTLWKNEPHFGYSKIVEHMRRVLENEPATENGLPIQATLTGISGISDLSVSLGLRSEEVDGYQQHIVTITIREIDLGRLSNAG